MGRVLRSSQSNGGLGDSDLEMDRIQGAVEGGALGTLTIVVKQDRKKSMPSLAVHIFQIFLLSLCYRLNCLGPRKSI